MLMLPRAYPDELLYSVIARFLAYGKGQLPQRGLAYRLMLELFGRPCRHRIDLPRYLDHVAEQTQPCWQLSASSIAEQHTLFPYLTYAVPEARRAAALAALCSDARSLVGGISHLHNWRVDSNLYLRICRECRLLDIETYGESYWHRVHQLPGVLVCPVHNTILHDSDALYQPHQKSNYSDVASAADFGAVVKAKAGGAVRQLLLAIAKQSADMLWHTKSPWHAASLWPAYRKLAIDGGFFRGSAALNRQKLIAEFRNFYSDKTLDILGITNELEWLGAMFSESQMRFHPLEHALVQVFLESVSVSEVQPSSLLGPWQCPNTTLKHSANNKLQIKVQTGRRGRYGKATCCCGFRFTFYNARDDAPDIPFIAYLKQAESSWVTHLKHRHDAGADYQMLSVEYGVAIATIKRILSNPLVTYELVDADQVYGWVAEWRRLRQTDDANTCRVQNYHLWKKLRQYAPEAMEVDATDDNMSADAGKLQRRTRGPTHWLNVDWTARDKLWSQELESAVTRLLVEKPVLPLFKARIVREADLKEMAVLNNLDQLPACKAVLTRTYETEDEYYIRRLRYAHEQMLEAGDEILPSILKRKANIARRPLSPVLRAEFDRLTHV